MTFSNVERERLMSEPQTSEPGAVTVAWQWDWRELAWYRLLRRPLLLIPAPVLALYMVYGYVTEPAAQGSDILLWAAGLALVLWAATIAAVVASVRWRDREVWRTPVEATADDAGLHLRGGRMTTSVTWDGLQDVGPSRGMLVLRWSSPKLAVMIPRRAFTTDRDLETFLRLARPDSPNRASTLA